MPLPTDVIRLFANPAAAKVITTVDGEGNVHAAPFGSLGATPDGSMLFFSQIGAEETPKLLASMKQAGKLASVVIQFTDTQKGTREGYSIACKVGETFTSGPMYDRVSDRIMKIGLSKPRAVWTLIPVRYKIHSGGPDREKTITL
jgi:hypothetical protein